MINKLALIAIGACSIFGSAATNAAYLTESHSVNGSIATAQFIDSIYFDNSFDRDINTQNASNISKLALHASVLGSGDGSVDFYSFNAFSGQAYFDIDYGYDFGGSFDSWLELYDATGTRLAFNDDSAVESGSFHGFDSFIDYTLQSDGLYYLAVGKFSGLGNIPFGANYTLHITQQAPSVSVVPVPAALWLFGAGLLGLAGVARRNNKSI